MKKLKNCLGLLALGLIPLTSCSPTAGGVFCPIPIHPSPEARAWLKIQHPPESVNEYLNDVGIQQGDIEKHCN